MDTRGTEGAHKLFRAQSSKAGNNDLHISLQECEISSHSNGQHSSPYLSSEDGGYTQRKIVFAEQGDLGISFETRDHNYCGISPWCIEPGSRQGIPKCEGSSEWKLKPQIFQKICSLRGTPDMDLFASRISHQVPAYRSWKLDPFSKGRDAFQTRWTHMKGYAFPPFSMIGRVLKKAQVDQANLMLTPPAWQTQPWLPHSSSDVYSESNYVTSGSRFAKRSPREASSFSNQSHTTLSGMDNFRKRLATEGISEKVASLISDSRRSGTKSDYESSWRKWDSWCFGRQVDPIGGSIANVLNF